MSDADIKAVIARQMPDAEKRRRADIVIQTGLSRHASLKALSTVDQGGAGVNRADPVRHGNHRPGAATWPPSDRGRGAGTDERPADGPAFPCADRS